MTPIRMIYDQVGHRAASRLVLYKGPIIWLIYEEGLPDGYTSILEEMTKAIRMRIAFAALNSPVGLDLRARGLL